MKYLIATATLGLVITGCQTSQPDSWRDDLGGVNHHGQPGSGWEPPQSSTEKEAWRLFFQSDGLRKVNDPKAIVVARQAAATLQPSDSDLAHGSLFNSVANTTMEMGYLDESIEFSSRALKYNEKGSDYVGIAISYQNMGDAYEKKNDLVNRNKYWRLAERIARDHNLDVGMKREIAFRIARINDTP